METQSVTITYCRWIPGARSRLHHLHRRAYRSRYVFDPFHWVVNYES